LRLLIDSVVSQSKLPTEWIIVDDGSTDNTSNVIQRAAVKNKWITYLRIDKDNNIDYYLSHLEAFYYGFNNKKTTNYDVIMKLDADLVLPNNYLELILLEFIKNQQVGICGGVCVIKSDDKYIIEKGTNLDHIRGAIKAYRKACFNEIGGVLIKKGWDTVDEHHARFKGWVVSVLTELEVIHQRSTAAEYGFLKASFRSGKMLYSIRMDLLLVLGNGIKNFFKQPYLISGLSLIAGYCYAFFTRHERIVPKDLGLFIRRYRYQKIFDRFK